MLFVPLLFTAILYFVCKKFMQWDDEILWFGIIIVWAMYIACACWDCFGMWLHWW